MGWSSARRMKRDERADSQAEPSPIHPPRLAKHELAIIQRLIDEDRLPPEPGISRTRWRPPLAGVIVGLLVWALALYGLWDLITD